MTEKIEYPAITVEENNLVIRISKKQLIAAIEGRDDEEYKVIEPDKLLERFAFHLANYAESNATETGLNELQYLFDRVTDALYESAEDIIENKNEGW